jgi:hypothetical protein
LPIGTEENNEKHQDIRMSCRQTLFTDIYIKVLYWQLILKKTMRNISITERLAGRLCSLMFGKDFYWQLVLKETTTNIRITERVAGRLYSLMFGKVLHWQLVLKKTVRNFIITRKDL